MKKFHSIFSTLGALVLAGAPLAAQGVSAPVTAGAAALKRNPYSMTGQLIFSSGESYYLGSGTVIHRRSVLTAAHNVWNPDSGWSTDLEFNRARSGNSSASRQLATRLFVFGSYRSATATYGVDSTRAFAGDLGGLRFSAMPAGGAFAGWRADTKFLTGAAPDLCLGYGAEVHSGNDLLVVEASGGFRQVLGALMESSSITFEAGMSGGPVFAEVAPDDFRVVGVIVAGSVDPPGAGIRALDATGAAFIGAYLRY